MQIKPVNKQRRFKCCDNYTAAMKGRGGLISGLPLVLYLDMPCMASLGLGREHILDFLRIDYASVGECEFAVLECPAVARPYEVSDNLTVFQMPVQVGLKPVYALCHFGVWSKVPDIYKTVPALYEETEYECFYLLV